MSAALQRYAEAEAQVEQTSAGAFTSALRATGAEAAGLVPAEAGAAEPTSGIPELLDGLARSVAAVDGEVKQADRLTDDLVTGKVTDLHEVAVAIRRADLSFKFALEVRNKLIEAYREVMRMGV